MIDPDEIDPSTFLTTEAESEPLDVGLETLEHWKERGIRILATYRGDRNMALDAFVMAHGWGDMIGCETAVDVALKHYGDPKKKAAVTKAIKLFQDCLGLPPMPGQRGEKGRKQMADARNKQLKKGNYRK